MIDLQSTVVVTGFGEFGPFGMARTRWEYEAYGKLDAKKFAS
jgi:3-oxoacyl-ACP reductase-like protein